MLYYFNIFTSTVWRDRIALRIQEQELWSDFFLLHFRNVNRCVLVSHSGFNLHFPNHLLAIVSSLVKMSIQHFLTIFIGFACFLIWNFDNSGQFLRSVIYKYFLQIYDLSFHSFNSIIQKTKVLKF